jgi:hypothetical protein
LPSAEREVLIKRADRTIFALLTQAVAAHGHPDMMQPEEH